MCDHRLWPEPVRAVLPGAVDADTTRDSSIDAMARRALDAVEGLLLPVGFSMGGIVALAMAGIAPDRIAGMVLLDTNASADLPARAAIRPRQQRRALAGELQRIVVEDLKPNYLAKANRSNAALRALLLDMALGLGERVFVQQSEALRTRPDLRSVGASLEAPMLIACGSEDSLCPPSWHQTLAASAKNAQLQIIGGAGHMLPLEQPGRLARAVANWRMN